MAELTSATRPCYTTIPDATAFRPRPMGMPVHVSLGWSTTWRVGFHRSG